MPCLSISPKAETKNRSFLRRFIPMYDIQVKSQMKDDDQAKLTFGFSAYSRKGKLTSLHLPSSKPFASFSVFVLVRSTLFTECEGDYRSANHWKREYSLSEQYSHSRRQTAGCVVEPSSMSSFHSTKRFGLNFRKLPVGNEVSLNFGTG